MARSQDLHMALYSTFRPGLLPLLVWTRTSDSTGARRSRPPSRWSTTPASTLSPRSGTTASAPSPTPPSSFSSARHCCARSTAPSPTSPGAPGPPSHRTVDERQLRRNRPLLEVEGVLALSCRGRHVPAPDDPAPMRNATFANVALAEPYPSPAGFASRVEVGSGSLYPRNDLQ